MKQMAQNLYINENFSPKEPAPTLSESGTPTKRDIGGFCHDASGIVFEVKPEAVFGLP